MFITFIPSNRQPMLDRHLRDPIGLLVVFFMMASTSCNPTTTPPQPASSNPAELSPTEEITRIPFIDTAGMQPDVKKRIEEIRQTVVSQPQSSKAWGSLGAICDIHEIYDQAFYCYLQAQALDPLDYHWPYLLGFVAERLGHPSAESLEYYRHTESLNASIMPAPFRRGEIHAATGNLEEAIKAYQIALNLDSKAAASHFGMGQVLLQKGNAEAAIAHLEEAAQLEPDDGPIWGALAQAYFRHGDKESARRAAENSRSLQPVATFVDPVRAEISAFGASSRAAYSRIGQLLLVNSPERAKAALPYLKQLQAVQSSDPYVSLWFGLAQLRLGSWQDFVRYHDEAIDRRESWKTQNNGVDLPLIMQRLDRDMAECVREYLEVMTGKDEPVNLQDAINRFVTAFERTEPTAMGHLSWGNALLKQGKAQEAVEHYAQAFQIDPLYTKAYYNIGYVLERANRLEEAIPYYRRAVTLEPDGQADVRLNAILKTLGKEPERSPPDRGGKPNP